MHLFTNLLAFMANGWSDKIVRVVRNCLPIVAISSSREDAHHDVVWVALMPHLAVGFSNALGEGQNL
jgi:hypothetical protein